MFYTQAMIDEVMAGSREFGDGARFGEGASFGDGALFGEGCKKLIWQNT